ncbi:hypothetical protein K458DRAFT_418488 [Lentithecium fluviatile CBS 122367]|uniref:Uncharacterized protein n=1 Tax=Lentithecium fluviatile CBS 122367 TaxID=1168545 RepID=A0A6G1J1T6_9PLEO|nr:hypothetical protein K458DRAFT_418488 [Lentithecium fluviatile CBS 122367]
MAYSLQYPTPFPYNHLVTTRKTNVPRRLKSTDFPRHGTVTYPANKAPASASQINSRPSHQPSLRVPTSKHFLSAYPIQSSSLDVPPTLPHLTPTIATTEGDGCAPCRSSAPKIRTTWAPRGAQTVGRNARSVTYTQYLGFHSHGIDILGWCGPRFLALRLEFRCWDGWMGCLGRVLGLIGLDWIEG